MIELGDKPVGMNDSIRTKSTNIIDGIKIDESIQLVDKNELDYFISLFQNPAVIEKLTDEKLN